MEDTTNTTVEQEQTSDGFMEGWDEDTLVSDEADQPEEQTEGGSEQVAEEDPATEETGGTAQTSQQTTEQGGEGTGAEDGQQAAEGGDTTQAQQPPVDAPKTWTLRHLDQVHTVGEADMVVLAQKGLDYDRIRGKYDESRPVMELFGSFAKQAGMSVPDYVAYIRTQAKKATGMSEAEAKRAVELEDREVAVAAKEAADAQRQTAQSQAAAAQASMEARRRADILEFQKTFPDVAKDPKSIPQEVWAEVRKGTSLVAAYSKYALAQAQTAQQTAEHKAAAATQNQKNAARSTGSMKTAGESTQGKDPFMDGFDE